ncbi:hypothetical protein BDF20DRAFT_900320 [Mycotypha africana]|uniref:uncharacterized protein n=1 Tax=Mycotypha africana TaxID=64632 RepID=UPI0022FFCD7A|nr:uncharacterized protein BDF20DRAFT_900320 [Mycotypha africana]KAI8967620.1 hypothetical protein BDF20DRAFT_900320 [Mycotypha africana]
MDSEVIRSLAQPHSTKKSKEHPWQANHNKDTSHFYGRRASLIEVVQDPYEIEYCYPIEHPNPPSIKPTSSLSTPLVAQQKEYNRTIDAAERIKFLNEIEQAREDLEKFRRNMAGLVKQMDNMTVDLEKSKDRVLEIDQDLTATQEVNVNLQVLLEKAVKTQKESDIFATQAIKSMYSDLASVIFENNQLQGRLKYIEDQQKNQKGNVHDIVKRMNEYTQMLEQAQGTIHMLQEPRLVKLASIASSSSETTLSRRTSIISDGDFTSIISNSTDVAKESSQHDINSNQPTILANGRKQSSSSYMQTSRPVSPLIKPQQGLKMLFNNNSGDQLGLGSIAQRRF